MLPLFDSYVWYGTNSYNFPDDVLPDPPAFEQTRCTECGKPMVLNCEAHSYGAGGIQCNGCMMARMGDIRPENVYRMDSSTMTMG